MTGYSVIAGLDRELQRASLELDETDAQRHSEVSGGECPLGDRWYDVSRSIRPRIGASGSSEGESSTVDRGALGPCGQLLSGGCGSESDAAIEGWSEAFWFGAMSVTDPAQYRSPDEEVVAYFCEQPETLLNVLDFMMEGDLVAPMPEGFLFSATPCIAQLFSHAAFHEGLYSGPFSLAHRAIGHSPLFQSRPQNCPPCAVSLSRKGSLFKLQL